MMQMKDCIEPLPASPTSSSLQINRMTYDRAAITIWVLASEQMRGELRVKVNAISESILHKDTSLWTCPKIHLIPPR